MMVNESAVAILIDIEYENQINCTGLGEVRCDGLAGWHSWSEHRQHVAEAQAAALASAGWLDAVVTG